MWLIGLGVIHDCELDPDPGPCEPDKIRWFFNSSSRLCEEFDYGCEGTGNRFVEQLDCLETCVCCKFYVICIILHRISYTLNLFTQIHAIFNQTLDTVIIMLVVISITQLVVTVKPLRIMVLVGTSIISNHIRSVLNIAIVSVQNSYVCYSCM